MTKEPALNVAVLDIGKTNVKLVLFNRRTNAQLAVLTKQNTVITSGLYPHYDVDGIWEFVLDGLGAFQSAHGVDGISITTHGATAVLMAGDVPAMPVLDYEFDGPDATSGPYEAIRPYFSETLSPRLPAGLNLGAQIFWQQQTFPEQFGNVTSILMYPQYWAHRLTGVLASETTSLGVHTDLWNPDQRKYSTLVERAGWGDLFPPVKPAASVLGTLKPEIAARTKLSPDTPVACGIHDSNASLLPYLNSIAQPFTVVSSGTWTIHMTVGGTTAALDPARDSLANVDANGNPVPTARFMGGREFEIIMGGATDIPADADVESVIAKKIMLLPGFVPGVGPFPATKGRWNTELENMTAGEYAAVASLYMALMSNTCLDLAGAGDCIIIEGPLARNAVYCAALAALAEKPVFISGDATGTSIGAAMLLEDANVEQAKFAEAVKPLEHEGLLVYAADWQAAANA